MSYLASRGIYRYEYHLSIPSSATGRLDRWSLDVGASSQQNISDPDLTDDASRRMLDHQNYSSMLVGMQSPNPSKWRSTVTDGRGADWKSMPWGSPEKIPTNRTEAEKIPWIRAPFLEAFPFGAGSEIGGFVLESKSPPAERTYQIWPARRSFSTDPSGLEQSCDTVSGTVLGPKLESEIVKFNGGDHQPTERESKLESQIAKLDAGRQQPAEVNRFLRYSRPTASPVALGRGTTSYDLVVVYGPTTQPVSFAASLDGADTSALFHPVPGATEVVRIPLHSGQNVLFLSIAGPKTSGQTATETESAADTDRLVFVVP